MCDLGERCQPDLILYFYLALFLKITKLKYRSVDNGDTRRTKKV